MAIKKRDWFFIALVVVVVGIFVLISGETKTSRVPYDDNHSRFFQIVREDGKKAAEKYCTECHNTEAKPLPADHPPAFRCLFCHKLAERPRP
jgi:hypothetical protein